jgi:hypothetical protein
VENLSKVRKEPEFKQKILTDLGELENIERRWLGGIVTGIIVGAAGLFLLLHHIEEIWSWQPATIPLIPYIILVSTDAVLLVVSLSAFAEYFSLSMSMSIHVGRGMVIRKRTGAKRSESDSDV